MNRKSIQLFAFGWFTAACCIALFYIFSPPSTNTDAAVEQPNLSSLGQIEEEKMISFLETKDFVVLNEEKFTSLQEKANKTQAESKPDKTNKAAIKAILHIEEGMTSNEVATLLHELEMIDDISEFEQQLTEKKAAKMIQAGFYELDDKWSTAEIIELITS